MPFFFPIVTGHVGPAGSPYRARQLYCTYVTFDTAFVVSGSCPGKRQKQSRRARHCPTNTVITLLDRDLFFNIILVYVHSKRYDPNNSCLSYYACNSTVYIAALERINRTTFLKARSTAQCPCASALSGTFFRTATSHCARPQPVPWIRTRSGTQAGSQHAKKKKMVTLGLNLIRTFLCSPCDHFWFTARIHNNMLSRETMTYSVDVRG